MRKVKATVILAVLGALAAAGGCSKNHGSSPTAAPVPTYIVSIAADKVRGRGLKLLLNNSESLYITRNQVYRFSTLLANGEPYDITVATQPTRPSQTCSLNNDHGVASRNISATLSCTTDKFTLGGTISGLVGEVVINNDVPPTPPDELVLNADGAFTFSKSITDLRNYSVSIFRQPTVQTCTVTNGSGTIRGADVSNVLINCQDNVPTISIQDASVVEGDTGNQSLVFTVTLSALARNDITVDYATADGTATTANNDYVATNGVLVISAGTSSGTIAVPVVGDQVGEANETLTVTLSNPSSNATFGVDSSLNPITSLVATGTIYNDDGGMLNDTGITLCGDYAGASGNSNNDLDCAAVGATTSTDGIDADGDPVPAGQDALYGRDVTANDNSDGHAGFSFEKLAGDGTALPANLQTVAWGRDAVTGYDNGNEAAGTKWSCVLDNTTGLTWEVKTDDNNVNAVHDLNWTYSWYITDSAANGGDAGAAGGGSCGASLVACDVETLLATVNAEQLCGHNDWRLPSAAELSSLIDSSVSSGATIDTNWFPNSANTAGAFYWSATPYASYPPYAWGVNFGSGGIVGGLKKKDGYYVRLVRGGR